MSLFFITTFFVAALLGGFLFKKDLFLMVVAASVLSAFFILWLGPEQIGNVFNASIFIALAFFFFWVRKEQGRAELNEGSPSGVP